MKQLTKEGVTVSYPETWEIIQNKEVVFSIARPSNDKTESFRENINLTIGKAITNKNLEETHKLTLQQLQKYLPEMNVESTESLTIKNVQFIKSSYRYTIGSTKLKVLFLQALKNDKGYNFTCTMLSHSFNDYSKIFDDVIKTIEIK